MKIYNYCVIVLFSLCSFSMSGQSLSYEKDLSKAQQIIDPLYNGDIKLAKSNKEKLYTNKNTIESVFLDAQILRWEYLPIYDQNDLIENQYLENLDTIIKNADIDNEFDRYIKLSVYLLLAEFQSNNNSLLSASNSGKKAYDLLQSKLNEDSLKGEWLLPVGLYNYFYSYYSNKSIAYKSLLYFFEKGDKMTGLKQLKEASHNESLIQGEALIYLSHIYLRLENKPTKAFEYAQKLVKRFPDNLKFYEFYIESAIALENFDETSIQLVNKLKSSDQVYFQKYGVAYDALINSIQNEGSKTLLTEAISYIELKGGGKHLLSLLYKRLYQVDPTNPEYEAKLYDHRVYDYKLTEI